MSDIFYWIGGNNAELASAGNWSDSSSPGVVRSPGANDVAIIQSGQGIHGLLNVAALDIVQSSGAPIISITGADTDIMAASISIANGFTLDDQAFLQAGNLSIYGNGTVVTVQNGAYLADQGGTDVFAIGASSGASTLLIKGGLASYDPQDASGTMSLGDSSGSVATMTISAGGNFTSALGTLRIGGVSGATGSLNVTGAGSEFEVDNDGTTTIGDFGELGGAANGSVSVTSGAYASLNSLRDVEIGTTGGTAEVLVSGTNSAIEATPRVDVGIAESTVVGEVLVQNGGEFDDATDFYLNNGTLSVTGANSVLTARSLEVEFDTAFQIGNGGLVHVADLDLAGVLTLAGGSVNVRAGLTLFGFDDAEIIGYGSVSAATIDADALIVASGGTLAISGAIAGGDGTDVTEEIDAGAILQLNGAVSSGQDIAFMANTGRLVLGDVAGFAGHIADFAAGDVLDLLNTTATGASLSGSNLFVTLAGGGTESFALSGLSADGVQIGTSGGATLVTGLGTTATLTTGTDIVAFVSGANTVSANASTLQAADTITGGSGTDTLALSGSFTSPFTFGAATLTSFEAITLAAGSNYDLILNAATDASGKSLTVDASALAAANALTLDGHLVPGALTASGGAGADTITGGTGADTLNGGAGNDVITAGAGADTVMGGPGNDTIYGNGGADTLSGNGGNDKLIGGAGADTLTGGDGQDTFVYTLVTDSTPASPDTITDFVHGTDKIDLSALHTNANDKLTIVSTGGYTYVEVDLLGNGSIDEMIKVAGTNSIATGDVIWANAAFPASVSHATTPAATVDHHDPATSLHAIALDHGLYG